MPWSHGAAAIVRERNRQFESEGHTFERDDTHTNGQLVAAARAYAWAAEWIEHHPGDVAYISVVPAGWPWEAWDWKPSPEAERNLVKAGALIAAEIDRLQRARQWRPNDELDGVGPV